MLAQRAFRLLNLDDHDDLDNVPDEQATGGRACLRGDILFTQNAFVLILGDLTDGLVSICPSIFAISCLTGRLPPTAPCPFTPYVGL